MPHTRQRRDAAAALARIPRHNKLHQQQMDVTSFEDVQDGQEPWIAVVTCSDSRVPLESIIGASDRLGKAFKCACAGNSVRHSIGSLEFAVHNLGVKLIAVQGHTECGAVLASLSDTSKLPAHLKADITHIQGCIHSAPEDTRLSQLDTATQATLANIRAQVKELSTHFEKNITEDGVLVAGLLYDLHNIFGRGYGKEYLYCIGDTLQTEALFTHPALAEIDAETRTSFLLPL